MEHQENNRHYRDEDRQNNEGDPDVPIRAFHERITGTAYELTVWNRTGDEDISIHRSHEPGYFGTLWVTEDDLLLYEQRVALSDATAHSNEPSDDEITHWREIAQRFIDQGIRAA